MRSSILSLIFLITANSAHAGLENPLLGTFKGLHCRTEWTTKKDDLHVKELRIERISPLGTIQYPEYKVTYTPTYLVKTETPKPEVLSNNIWLREVAKSNTSLLDLTNGTNVNSETGWGYGIESKLVTTTVPYFDDTMEYRTLEFRIVHYQLDLSNLGLNAKKVESFQVDFHPSQCVEL